MVAARSLLPALTAAAAASAAAGGASAPRVQPFVLASTADLVLMVTILAAVGAAGVLAFRVWTEGRFGRRSEQDRLPPLVFPTLPARSPRPGERPRDARTDAAARAGAAAMARKAGAAQRAGTAGSAAPARAPSSAARPAGTASRAEPARAAVGQVRRRTVGPAAVEGAAASANGDHRQVEPAAMDATLQILPGRLEVLSGDAGLEEIRFVQAAGGTPVITLGRSVGGPPEHVQLRSPAVSRLHARMRFDGGRWYVCNLSETNPAVVNGAPLGASGDEQLLRDGDQLELGDVVLRFRS